MSANVWFEEVNTGLISEIHSHVKINNNHGVLTPLHYDPETPEKNAIIVRKPEEDFKIEIFPSVSIYNKTYEHDPLRYHPAPAKLGVDKVQKVIEMEESAVPFKLFYQIDFWARYQTDMDCMTRTWLMRHFRQFNLSVVDDGGVPRSCNCMQIGQVTKSDLVLNKERLFHSLVNLEIWVELDDETRYNMPVVITHDVKAKQKGEVEYEDGKLD